MAKFRAWKDLNGKSDSDTVYSITNMNGTKEKEVEPAGDAGSNGDAGPDSDTRPNRDTGPDNSDCLNQNGTEKIYSITDMNGVSEKSDKVYRINNMNGETDL